MQRNLYDGALTAMQPGNTNELLVTNKLNVRYECATETLNIGWEGEVSSLELRHGYNLIMKHVQHLKPKKWHLDLHKRCTITRQDQRWVFQEVFPEVLRMVNDDVFVAVILPVSLYHGLVAELEGDELIDRNNFLIIQHFLYREEAQRWLNEMCLPKVAK